MAERGRKPDLKRVTVIDLAKVFAGDPVTLPLLQAAEDIYRKLLSGEIDQEQANTQIQELLAGLDPDQADLFDEGNSLTRNQPLLVVGRNNLEQGKGFDPATAGDSGDHDTLVEVA